MARYTTAADMALLDRAGRYKCPCSIPISYRIDGNLYRGIPQDFAPEMTREFLDANISRTTVTGKTEDGIEIKAEYTEYRDYPVVEWVAYFTNTAKENSKIISDIRIIDEVFAGESPVFTWGNGDTCGEDGYQFYKESISADSDVKEVAPYTGLPCQGASPFMKLTFSDYELRFGIGWPALWNALVSLSEEGVSFSVGQKRCHMYLKPEETIRTPRVSIMASEADEDHSRNLWRHWYFDHILPREHGEKLPPKLCLHTWMIDGKPEFTGITEANQISGIDDYLNAGLKPDIWWIDAGWYKCDYDWPRTGTWKEDAERLPNGLAPVGKKCHDNDIQLLVWFEPERVRAGEELHREHPEWCLSFCDNCGGDYLLDLGNKDCCEWLIDRIDGIIKEAGIDIYRQDFNYDPLPVWKYNEKEDRIGAMENAHVQGYLHYWDELMFRNPNLWMDSCASGGRRNEMETLRRAVPLHYTDVGYGKHPIKQIQHRLMFEWIPYFRAHTMNWDNAEGGYENGGKPVDEYAYQCAMAPSVTSMIEHYASEQEFALGRRMDTIWRRAAEIMLEGDYYPLTECRRDPHDWYVMQFDNPEKREGFIQFVRNTQAPDESFTAKFHVSEDAEVYEFENSGNGEIKTFTGTGLLNKGFTVSLPIRSGEVWFYNY